jgi:hypothetical protein
MAPEDACFGDMLVLTKGKVTANSPNKLSG